MLILNRKARQGKNGVRIQGNILVRVLSVDKVTGVVELGFAAPKEIAVWRDELEQKELKP